MPPANHYKSLAFRKIWFNRNNSIQFNAIFAQSATERNALGQALSWPLLPSAMRPVDIHDAGHQVSATTLWVHPCLQTAERPLAPAVQSLDAAAIHENSGATAKTEQTSAAPIEQCNDQDTRDARFEETARNMNSPSVPSAELAESLRHRP